MDIYTEKEEKVKQWHYGSKFFQNEPWLVWFNGLSAVL